MQTLIRLALILAGINGSSAACAADIRYAVSASHTDIRILVYKQGTLQLFGHNHVISATDISGQINYNRHAAELNSFNLEIPVARLVVDRPEDRRRSGPSFTTEVDSQAAQATTANLLGRKLLHAGMYPHIRVAGRIDMLDRHRTTALAHIRITVRNRDQHYQVPVELQLTDNVLVARGRLRARQSDFAIEPMALLGGLLAVRDDFDVIFSIQAMTD